jgi:hypothetical protein
MAAACGPGSRLQDGVGGGESLPPALLWRAPREGVVAGNVPGIPYDGSSRPIKSFEELVHLSDIIAIVMPESKVGEEWSRYGIGVASVFRLRMIRVMKGDVMAGDTVLAYAPGGVVRATWPANSSRKPSPGDTTVTEEFPDHPFYNVGEAELVFLWASDDDVFTSFGRVYGAPEYGRYTLANERLVSILAKVPSDPTRFQSGSFLAAIIGKSLDELESRVRATRPCPTPTNPRIAQSATLGC